jgi:hypothetical protein
VTHAEHDPFLRGSAFKGTSEDNVKPAEAVQKQADISLTPAVSAKYMSTVSDFPERCGALLMITMTGERRAAVAEVCSLGDCGRCLEGKHSRSSLSNSFHSVLRA